MSVAGSVLIVEDEEYVRDSLVTWLERKGYQVAAVGSVEEALGRRAFEGADLVISDLRLPGAGGLELVERLGASKGPPVVVLTGHGTVASAVECMQAGAVDYLLKPVAPEELVMVVERVLAELRLRREVSYLREAVDREAGEPVGESAAWRQVVELLEIAAPVNTPVLLIGESGSGKEEAARLLHRKSARADAPFVTVNCAAIPLELFESELFGHRKGAFTGAVSDREGRFQVAHGGTLFLDEVNSLPKLAQAKLLRVLQDGAFERVGESRPTSVDVRLVCASNAELVAEVAAGRFRPDLFYRINVMTVRIPPLRERPEDVELLAGTFLRELAARFAKPIRELDPESLKALQAYPWPGNVRELRNVIERAVLLERSDLLRPGSLGLGAGALSRESPGARSPGEGLHLRSTLQRTERELLEAALERAGGVRRQAARLLGIDERNLSYFLKKHGL